MAAPKFTITIAEAKFIRPIVTRFLQIDSVAGWDSGSSWGPVITEFFDSRLRHYAKPKPFAGSDPTRVAVVSASIVSTRGLLPVFSLRYLYFGKRTTIPDYRTFPLDRLLYFEFDQASVVMLYYFYREYSASHARLPRLYYPRLARCGVGHYSWQRVNGFREDDTHCAPYYLARPL